MLFAGVRLTVIRPRRMLRRADLNVYVRASNPIAPQKGVLSVPHSFSRCIRVVLPMRPKNCATRLLIALEITALNKQI